MRTLQVDLGERSYPIIIGSHLLGQGDLLRPYIAGRQVAIVTNSTVAPLYLERLQQALGGGVGQHALGVAQRAHDQTGVELAGRHDGLLDLGMHGRLLRGNEARAHVHALRAHRQ